MNVTQKSIQALQGLPFDNLIGGPLNACIRAQADAALSTMRFINDVGLNDDGNGNKEAIYVYFSFVQGGRKAVMSVPLLTIVPIPYIAINTIDINFKATITGVESSSLTNELSQEYNQEATKETKTNLILHKRSTNIKTSVSSKRDSKSTRDSSFSIESTIDVAVHASQDSMPAGMAKVLEMLGNSMDLLDPNGELTLNDTEFELEDTTKDKATLIVQYKTPKGEFDTTGKLVTVKAKGSDGKPTGTAITAEPHKSEGTLEYALPYSQYGYVVEANGNEIDVNVTKKKETAPAGSGDAPQG
jgi:hypothetical protein